jgi:hypothetical protein
MTYNITFEVSEDKKHVSIMNAGNKIGQIFLEAKNLVQVCGFTEACDLWACGPFDGKKDIRLLFDDTKLPGKFTEGSFNDCMRCYREPCCCENKREPVNGNLLTKTEFELKTHDNPFNVKRSNELDSRIEK